MLDSSIARTGRSLESGLRSGMAIGGAISQGMSKNALQEAQARINAGEDYNAVIQQLMAKDPSAAQQLMNLKQGSMQLDAQAQEMDMIKQKYGMQKLQTAAMPMLGAIMQNDPKVQDKLIDEASLIFKGQSDGVYESLQGIKGLQGNQRIDALTGLVKTMRSAGIFPEDPSQLQNTPAAVQEFEYYKGLAPDQQKQFGLARGYIPTGKEEARTPQEKNFEIYNKLLAEGKKDEAQAFGRSAGIVSKEGQALTAFTEKRLGEFSDAAVNAGRTASKFEILANDFEKSGIQGGLVGQGGTWSETVKDLTGNQDEISELRREFNKIRASEVVNNLPPGAASDADIALALSGFPTDKANATQVASFLRGVAKLKKFEEGFNTFKAKYISDRGTERGMLEAWKASQGANQSATQDAPPAKRNYEQQYMGGN